VRALRRSPRTRTGLTIWCNQGSKRAGMPVRKRSITNSFFTPITLS
jgi:hypothetical protein